MFMKYSSSKPNSTKNIGYIKFNVSYDRAEMPWKKATTLTNYLHKTIGIEFNERE